ncbi:unnamed protein product [Lactuca virosa]|uniref:Uncharacterized protein n=1 Tax=Lactuca virosa TaxID=75947 RepID=A0AAU9PTP1_9ASTR|nr:unnamed protein product [Lactuca virosa]
MEVLLSNHSLSAQEWIVDCDDCDVDEVDPKTIDEALATDVSQAPRESPKTRELFDEDFESESEEQVLEEDEYESDKLSTPLVLYTPPKTGSPVRYFVGDPIDFYSPAQPRLHSGATRHRRLR